jgi:hypothetical protein
MTDAELNPTGATEVLRFKRHAFGIWILYLAYGFAFISAIVIVILILPQLDINLSTSQKGMVLAGTCVAAAFGSIFLLLAHYIYWRSEMCVTESAVSEVVQYGLFSRHVARLDMEKIEDVTAVQKGIFPTMFNYGTLMIETAGEVENFVFLYCPDPNHTAQVIHQARQKYLDRRMHETAQAHAYTLTQQGYPMQQFAQYPQQPMAAQQPAQTPQPEYQQQAQAQYPQQPDQQVPQSQPVSQPVPAQDWQAPSDQQPPQQNQY